ncbi:hypothetical protein C8A00DRAFT_17302 [Chaetomidium leptoderma]|uniref:Uncharacterized protein n=1 Tax=Chaetomidium leptoderma TaxID=669021 RepID=A0AAN6ZTG8_9PEZI|nr:hypothetical protein C8A00DRAFT_17302 [Chaetomidium leptoderma]
MTLFDALLLLSLLFGSVFSDSGRCYFPDGQLAKFAVGCWDAPVGQTGLCCQSGDQCLNNTLCATKFVADEPLYYRGSCLDSTWSNSACPRFCLELSESDRILPVYRCADDDSQTRWYCGGDGGSADDSCAGGSFDLSGNMDVYATAGTKPKPSPVISSDEESPTTLKGSTGDQDIASNTSRTDAIQPSSGAPAAAPFSTSLDGVESGSPTALPPDTPQDEEGKSSSAVPIGVGVAVGTSVLIAASVLVFFYQRRRRRQAPVRAETPPPFEFSFINNQAPGRPSPSYGAKLPETTHGKNLKYMSGLGGTARYELP